MGFLKVQGYAKKTELIIGKTLLEHLRRLDVDINASCGGLGECKQCLVQVNNSDLLGSLTDSEREIIRQPGYRLSCQARVVRDDEDLFVIVPERNFTILPTGKRKNIELDPCVKRISLHGNTVYWRNKELGIYEGALLGVALDIGTTTLSMYCTDLETGEDILVVSRENPQIKYGNDVISRITYATNHGQGSLEKEIRNAVNGMLQNLPVDPHKIYEAVIVGNPTMRDLFFGLPVKGLGEAPYNPYMKTSIYKQAKDLELNINPNATIYGMPLISGFIGADCISVVLATNLHKDEGLNIAIDIGTNTEIVFGNKDRMIATSCASGPAFEGVGIKWGVAGVGGAIKNVSIDQDLVVKYETIGDLPPIGICGSGLIDVLANLLDREIIDWRGRFTEETDSFVIVDRDNPITISEEDIDKLKLAKAAISLGVKTLVKLNGSKLRDVDTIFLAGGFGNFIDVENAIKIGLLPNIELKKIERVGNAALEGAREALLSDPKRKDVDYIEKNTEHKSLESIPDFSYEYMKELSFEEYKKI
jgi:uncharacterized 2Fe-2S/4Fe-4S cluster protein (DUF4445 family)